MPGAARTHRVRYSRTMTRPPTFVAKFTPDGALEWNTFFGGDTWGVSDLFVALAGRWR